MWSRAGRSLFIVVAGAVKVEERQVHHLEGTSGTIANMRLNNIEAGGVFHHYPLVTQSPFYGYGAKVVHPVGASLVMIPRTDYVSILRRSIEQELNTTVHMLKATPFFSNWSETSIARLYFWFSRRHYQAEEDVVSQGDDADFCFIIRSGRCDVLVEMNEEEEEVEPSVRRLSVAADIGGVAESPQTSPDVSPEMRRPGGESDTAKKAKLQELMDLKNKQKALKLSAAAAFLGKAGANPDSIPLRHNMRHVVTLKPGAIVGEIALFKDGVKRMATVRTSDPVEVLILDKKSFLDLDRATLNIISENARYNAACTKEPNQRTRDDLQILQQRTAHLSHIAALSNDVHLELCRVMRYRKVGENAILVRKGMPALCLYVIISGSAATYVSEPRPTGRKWGMISVDKGPPKKKNANAEAYLQMKPHETLHSGQAIGEDELLQEDPVHAVTAITTEPVELMEIDRRDFDRILKADRTSEKGRLIDFLTTLPMFEGVSVAALNALSNSVARRAFLHNQPCLAYPPNPELGAASYSQEYVYIIYSGECRLVAGAADGAPPPIIDSGSPAYGALVNNPPPDASKVLRYLGNTRVPVVTLGSGECIFDPLMTVPGTRWCLKPSTPIEFLVIPRKEWQETVRNSAMQELRKLASERTTFIQVHLNRMIASSTLNVSELGMRLPDRSARVGAAFTHSPRAVARAGFGSFGADATHSPSRKRLGHTAESGSPPVRTGMHSPSRKPNAYEPIRSPRSLSPHLNPIEGSATASGAPRQYSPTRASGGSPRKGESLPALPAGKGAVQYTPAIRTKPSAIGSRPLHS